MVTKATNAAGAGAAAPVTDEVRATDGATIKVAGTSEAAVALGEAAAVAKGGPGVGAAQIVEEAAGDLVGRTTRLDEAAGIERTGHLGDRLGTFPRKDELRTRAGLSPSRPVETAVVSRKPGRHEILPMSGPTIDPETVPGLKVAKVAAQTRRNGRSYVAGEEMLIDFRAHSELVPIGAIVATSWHDLPDHEG